MTVDPRTPVIVGVGQAAERIGEPDYRAMSAVELAAAVGGQGPQRLLTELAATIATGAAEVARVFGSDATSTTRHFAKASPASPLRLLPASPAGHRAPSRAGSANTQPDDDASHGAPTSRDGRTIRRC